MTALTLHDHEIRRLLSTGSALVLRPVKPQPDNEFPGVEFVNIEGNSALFSEKWGNQTRVCLRICPLGIPGSVAWVRERFAIYCGGVTLPDAKYDGFTLAYPDGTLNLVEYINELPPPGWNIAYAQMQRHANVLYNGDWRSPVTMPRWASRCDVTVQDVHVLRINELSQDDESMAGFTDDIPAYNHIHFQNDWLRRYARRFPDDLWQVWTWAITVGNRLT